MANDMGLRSVAVEVHDLGAAATNARYTDCGMVGGIDEYENSRRMAYVRSPREGIIGVLAQSIGSQES